MVDSNDRDRVVEARDELHRMLNEVLIFYKDFQISVSAKDLLFFFLMQSICKERD